MPYKKGHEENQWMTERVHYAYNISNDPEFIYTLNSENGSWDHTRQSNFIKNGIREKSWGFCQINEKYHPEIISDYRMFTNWRWQMEQCLNLYLTGTPMYGRKNNHKSKQAFIWK